jgi:hypothetical protein
MTGSGGIRECFASVLCFAWRFATVPLGTGSYICRDQNPFMCALHFRQQVSPKHIFSLPNYFGYCKAVLLASGCCSGARNPAYSRGNTTRFKFKWSL